MGRWKRASLAAVLLTIPMSLARAEVAEITVAQQFGVSFLPMMIMERDKLIEKHARAAGIDKLEVNWVKVAGPSVMNDGLLSNTIHFAAVGAPSMITLWSKTKGGIGVKGIAAMTTYPLYLVTRNPDVRSLKDLSDKDKIVVPSVKISTQAIMLQMAAAELYGLANYTHFDAFTISLSHPDGLLAIMNNTAGVNAHFTSSPFYEQEIKFPGARVLTTNYEILGGPATALLATASSKFRDANPKIYAAFYHALAEAIDMINKDKRAAARIYLDMARDTKNSVDDILSMIANPDYAYTLAPQKVFKTAQFMNKVGSVKDAPASWKDLFFPEVHGQQGD